MLPNSWHNVRNGCSHPAMCAYEDMPTAGARLKLPAIFGEPVHNALTNGSYLHSDSMPGVYADQNVQKTSATVKLGCLFRSVTVG